MKWYLLGGLVVLWLSSYWSLLESNVKAVGNEVVKSRRVLKPNRDVSSTSWRSLPEDEMSVEEMAQYAAGLSDEELMREFSELSILWCEKNNYLEYPKAPRLVVFMAREFGRRNGKAGFDLVLDRFYDHEERREEAGSDDEYGNLDGFKMQMEAAVFGGFIKSQPEEAIQSLLSMWEGYENQSVGGYYESFADVSQSDMIGKVLNEMARHDPELAFSYLVKAQEGLPWHCPEMISDFFEAIPESDRADWITRAEKYWPREKFYFSIPLSSPDKVIPYLVEYPNSRGWEVIKSTRNLHPSTLIETSQNLEINFNMRFDIVRHLFNEDLLPVESISSYPIDLQENIVTGLVDKLRGYNDYDYLGPLDGEEILREQDRGARIDLLEEILSISDLGLESKKELLEVLEKHRQELTN